MRICSVPGCGKPYRARGLCDNCYKKATTKGALPPKQRHVNLAPSDDPLYKIWGGLRNRCNNPNNHSYARYGGKGVTVCEEWDTFDTFYRDMLEGYEPGLYIDRINPERGYCKINCRWVTPSESSRNRSFVKLTIEKARLIKLLYKEKPETETITRYSHLISDLFGIAPKTVRDVLCGRIWMDA